jgi:serine/threonine-protein kinase RsbW
VDLRRRRVLKTSFGPESIALHVPAVLGSVRLAAAAIRGIAETVIDEDDAGQIEVVVAEVGNNIILHGYASEADPSDDRSITITVETRDDCVVLVFEDDGPPFDPVSARAGTPEESIARGGGGLGLFIMRQIMDELSYDRIDEKNVFRLVKFRDKNVDRG